MDVLETVPNHSHLISKYSNVFILVKIMNNSYVQIGERHPLFLSEKWIITIGYIN